MSNYAPIKIQVVCPVTEKEVTIPAKSITEKISQTTDEGTEIEFMSDFRCPACEGYHFVHFKINTPNVTVIAFEETTDGN